MTPSTPQADSQPAPDEIINMAREQGLPETEIEGVFRVNADDLCRVAAAILAARGTGCKNGSPGHGLQEWQPVLAARGQADSVTAPAGGVVARQGAGREADRIVKWSDRVQRAHPKSEPEFWPDALRVKYMADEISDLRAALAQADSVTAPAGGAEEVDKALNDYAQAFMARAMGWTREHGDAMPDARTKLYSAISSYARGLSTTSPTPQADSQPAPTDWYEGITEKHFDLAIHKAIQRDRAARATADSVLEDAARYRYLRDGDWREHEKLESVIRLQLNALWDETIDAAVNKGGA